MQRALVCGDAACLVAHFWVQSWRSGCTRFALLDVGVRSEVLQEKVHVRRGRYQELFAFQLIECKGGAHCCHSSTCMLV